jgi:hypothetical protein
VLRALSEVAPVLPEIDPSPLSRSGPGALWRAREELFDVFHSVIFFPHGYLKPDALSEGYSVSRFSGLRKFSV